jgi:hypothetical protein
MRRMQKPLQPGSRFVNLGSDFVADRAIPLKYRPNYLMSMRTGLSGKPYFSRRINVIPSVQPSAKKYSAFAVGQMSS